MTIDLAVIGCGPAGISAATTAARAGLDVVVLDEQNDAGGQIYRNITSISHDRDRILGDSYVYGRRLAETMKKAGVWHISEATVWHIDPGQSESCCTVTYSINQQAHVIRAARVIIATGALERPVPVPGWTLPGVLTAGAAQILLKQSDIVIDGAVIAGAGPLNLLLAQQMIRAGTPPLAIVETQSRREMFRALSHITGALKGWHYLKQGLKMLRDIKSAGVKHYRHAGDLRIDGDQQVERIYFSHQSAQQSIDCSTVLLHQGVIPNTQISRSLELDHAWDNRQQCFSPKLNEWQQTSVGQVYIAGDGAGIGGAMAAELTGRIAALHAACSLNKLSRDQRDSRVLDIRKALSRELAIRPFLDQAYSAPDAVLNPDDDTIVCRCEEITAGQIRYYASLGCKGPNQTKAFGRCGMGPCQGRYCGLTVTQILARQNNMHPDEVGYYRIRPPIKPITVGELASLDSGNDFD